MPESLNLPIWAVGLLVAVLAAGALALITVIDGRKTAQRSYIAMEDVASDAGCHVSEFDGNTHHNPPVTGKFLERNRAADGSYVGRRSPSVSATVHALYHGRVAIQYRPELAVRQVRALEGLVASDSDRMLLFANQTGMQAPVAATAYLSVMTCPRVDQRTLHALRVYRDRRRGFGQAF
jgi:hypothetical protein